MPAAALALLEKGVALMPKHNATLIAKGSLVQRQLEELIGPRAVMICPSLPNPAPRHAEPLLRILDSGQVRTESSATVELKFYRQPTHSSFNNGI